MNTLQKIFILFSLCVVFLVGTPQLCHSAMPKPAGYVVDEAGLVTQEAKQVITAIADELNKKTGVQIAVVTVQTLDGETIERYAVNMFEQWGIGAKKKDTGLLLLVALKERRVRIEVGYGLEGVITDGTAGEIIRNSIVPFFRDGQYTQGIVSGFGAIVERICTHYNVQIEGLSTTQQQQQEGKSGLGGLLFLGILFLFFGWRAIFFPMLFGSGGGYWGGGRGGFGGGSFGGGFGGFGGGGSGGGGASGGW